MNRKLLKTKSPVRGNPIRLAVQLFRGLFFVHKIGTALKLYRVKSQIYLCYKYICVAQNLGNKQNILPVAAHSVGPQSSQGMRGKIFNVSFMGKPITYINAVSAGF